MLTSAKSLEHTHTHTHTLPFSLFYRVWRDKKKANGFLKTLITDSIEKERESAYFPANERPPRPILHVVLRLCNEVGVCPAVMANVIMAGEDDDSEWPALSCIFGHDLFF